MPGVAGALVAALVLALSAGAAPASAQVVPERTLHAAHRLAVIRWRPPATTGQVASVEGNTATGSCGTSGATGSFTLTDRKGTTVTVDVTSSTAFAGWNMSSPSYEDVCVGSDVAVLGTSASTASALVAAKVYVLATPPHRAPAAAGQVASVEGNTATGSCGTSGATGSFTLTDRKGATVTVDVTSSTAFAGWNMSSPSYADVCVGTDVAVLGTSASTPTTLVAAKVYVLATPPHRAPAAAGQVASVEGNTATGSCGTSGATGSFTLTDRKGATVTVDVTSSTAFAGWNVPSPSYADVCVGSDVAVLGTSASTASALVAAKVFVLAPGHHTGPGTGGKPATHGTHGATGWTGPTGGTGTAGGTWPHSGTDAPAPTDTTVDGTVTAKTDSSLTVDDQGRAVPVGLGASTIYRALGGPSSLQDVAIGDRVHVVGTTADGTVIASSVTVVAGGSAPGASGSANTPDEHPGGAAVWTPVAPAPPTTSDPRPSSGSGWSQTPTTPSPTGGPWSQSGASSEGNQGTAGGASGGPGGLGGHH